MAEGASRRKPARKFVAPPEKDHQRDQRKCRAEEDDLADRHLTGGRLDADRHGCKEKSRENPKTDAKRLVFADGFHKSPLDRRCMVAATHSNAMFYRRNWICGFAWKREASTTASTEKTSRKRSCVITSPGVPDATILPVCSTIR